MKIKTSFKTFLLIAFLFFLAGYGASYFTGGNKKVPDHKILYYVDPMNPAYRSDKPGISPACGMPLEPVYADEDSGSRLERSRQKSMPPGTIRITPEKQQMIGVKTVKVEKIPWQHTQRVLGRVLPDEMRIYRVNAAISGSIQEISPVTTGSLVKKDELLASFYSPEYRQTLIAYIGLLKPAGLSSPPGQAGNQTTSRGIADSKEVRKREIDTKRVTGILSADYYRKILLNYGVTPHQLEEMERTGTIPDNIDIRAPVSGFVLSRNISAGLNFDRGTEFFRIADLSRVWIQADLFENEAALFKPGMRVKAELPYRKKIFYAQISEVLPQFDSASRTLKIRLTADNPGYILRPDMPVNLEFSLTGPPALIVPAEAVLDSGLRKTVFVDRGNGFFEPREVETGRSLGERVEITRGIRPGEKIVVSGNFLLDSESRLKLAGNEKLGKIIRDPVCGMDIDEDRSRESGNFRVYQGKRYFFCSPECRDQFIRQPLRYSTASASDSGKKIPEADSKEGEIKQKNHGTRPMPESIGKENKPKPAMDRVESKKNMDMARPKKAMDMVKPKLTDSGTLPKPKASAENQGALPEGKSTSSPFMPPAQKPAGLSPEFMDPSRPTGNPGSLPPGFNPSPKTETKSMPLPTNPSQPKGEAIPPIGTPSKINSGEKSTPLIMPSSEPKSGETSQPFPPDRPQNRGRRTFRMIPPSDIGPGRKPAPLPGTPQESQSGVTPSPKTGTP